jgi:hypothetical protein
VYEWPPGIARGEDAHDEGAEDDEDDDTWTMRAEHARSVARS